MRFMNIQTTANKSSINVSKGVSSSTTQFITYVMNCVVNDGTPLDTFTDLSTTGMCHLNIITASQAPTHKFTWQKQHQQEEGSFHQHNELQFQEETSKVLHLEHSFVWCWNLDTLESESEIPRTFWNVVLEKDDQLDKLCNKCRSITNCHGQEYPTNNKKGEGYLHWSHFA